MISDAAIKQVPWVLMSMIVTNGALVLIAFQSPEMLKLILTWDPLQDKGAEGQIKLFLSSHLNGDP